jgi:hypothetical protein
MNKYNSKKQKHGYWEYNRDDIKIKANYFNGEHHGVFETYKKNNLIFTRNFYHGKYIGLYINFTSPYNGKNFYI